MKKLKLGEAQVVPALKRAEARVPVDNPVRKYGVSRATFCAWRKKYAVLDPSETRWLSEFEATNKNLKELAADLALDKQILQESSRQRTEACMPS